MFNRSFLALIFAVLCLVSSAGASPASIQDEETSLAISSLIEGARASNTDAMLVLRDGRVVAEYYRSGKPPGAIETMSVTKSLIALAVGRLVTQGKIISLDQPVSDFYPEWRQGRKAKITIRMLLDQTSGLQNVPMASEEIYPAPDLIKLALAAELSDEPGKVFSYNNKAMNLLAGIIEKASGKRMDRYIESDLLRPMGIEGNAWNTAFGFDPAGNPYAMSGWKATAQDAAKIGQLVLDEGRWENEQLIDSGFIRAMVAQSPSDYRYYGFLWWRRTEAYPFEVDAAGVDKLAASGLNEEQIARIKPFTGRRFGSSRELLDVAFVDQRSRDEVRALLSSKGLSLRTPMRQIHQPILAYEANGFLGQYIVVVPRARLVAVRQVQGREVSGDWPDGYDDFTSRVLRLAKAFEPDLSVEPAVQ